MARFELKLPKMGESVAEATITAWLKEVGDRIEADDSVVEIATDKVDSDVPCELSGTLVEILHEKDAVVKVGQTLAIIEVEGELEGVIETGHVEVSEEISTAVNEVEKQIEKAVEVKEVVTVARITDTERFYSPLVKNIAMAEGISKEELEKIPGTGLDGRVTKADILAYIAIKLKNKKAVTPVSNVKTTVKPTVALSVNGEDELIELSRMGKMISDHMVHSIQKSAHVQSFIEVDVTNLVIWRTKNKDSFLEKVNEKLTYTPVFMMAVAQAIKKYPLVNLSFDGDKKVVIRKKINLGLAAALGDGNLIVPVIHNADALNLIGMAKTVNDLAGRAKINKLKPDEIQGGTYTVTNVGGFGSLFGTPIINQPEAAILALGAIRKVPAVIETPEGDTIGIRQKMFLSHSYDHRVINGALGGLFIKFIKEYLENWDPETSF